MSQHLTQFYGEHQGRIDTVASVVLDAMERDEYWQVLKKIDEARTVTSRISLMHLSNLASWNSH